MILDTKYTDYINLNLLVMHNFYVGYHTLDKAAAQILQFSFNHITLTIL